MSIQAGTYKGRGIPGSEQFGKTEKGDDQLILDLELAEGSRVSTILYFSEKAAPYALERLHALGASVIDRNGEPALAGLDTNEVDVVVKYETWEGKERMRVDILTVGRITPKEEMAKAERTAFLRNLGKSLGAPAAAKPQAGRDYPANWDDNRAPAPAAGGVKF